ncbi:hypothetical protein NQZ68_036182 [Dissostichus eleginoides]|nr:hypothetical protein NQZ68_036182 [Dissostichus eleginoides]
MTTPPQQSSCPPHPAATCRRERATTSLPCLLLLLILLLTALVAIHPLSSCTITDGGNNIASAGYHNNRPQHTVRITLALHHHAPSAGLREAVSAVVIHFTRYHHHHGHGGTFLRLFGLSIERGRWPL